MNSMVPQYVAGFYGLAVIASGITRFVQRSDGEKGLWFGLIMGSVAVLAALFFWRGRMFVGQSLIWISILFVGGWFVYEALIKKGFSDAEPRMLAVIVLTILAALFFLICSTAKMSLNGFGAKRNASQHS